MNSLICFITPSMPPLLYSVLIWFISSENPVLNLAFHLAHRGEVDECQQQEKRGAEKRGVEQP